MTPEGKINLDKIRRWHIKIINNLNSYELSHLVHKLIEEKHILVKTVHLVNKM